LGSSAGVESMNYVPLTILVTGIAILSGCAAGFDPKPIESVPFRERTLTQIEDGLRVSAAVPSATETRDLFGVALYKKGVQPVWIEIENGSGEEVSFMPVAVDTDYHSPIEVAALNRSKKARARAEQYFFQNGVSLRIGPGEVRSGFVFTNLDEGTKAFNVDVIGDARSWQFTFFVQVPGLAVDHSEVDFEKLYTEEQIVNFTDPLAFVAALEQLPCCVVDAKAENNGDPLNLVMIGKPDELFYAFIRSGWDETEVVTVASGFKTATSFFTGGAYRYSPISSLYLFGRRQDIAVQRIRKNIHERNHFRLWLAPMTFNSQLVWVGQISRDIGVRFTAKTITTHKIDPDVDETREFLLENLAYHQTLAKFAYVGGSNASSIDEPGRNLTGDPYYTDGLRLVIWIASEPKDLQDIMYVDWSDPEG
jgi:hypothetical protein